MWKKSEINSNIDESYFNLKYNQTHAIKYRTSVQAYEKALVTIFVTQYFPSGCMAHELVF